MGLSEAQRRQIIEDDPYKDLTGQARFDAYQRDGLVDGFRSQMAGNQVYRINRTDGFNNGDIITTDQGTFRYGQLRGNLGHFVQQSGPPMPEFEMPEFVMPEFNMPDFEFDIPEPPELSVPNPGTQDVQSLKSKRGSLRGLTNKRNLTSQQLKAIRTGAAKAGLNLPI